jgi:hypothetical protein
LTYLKFNYIIELNFYANSSNNHLIWHWICIAFSILGIIGYKKTSNFIQNGSLIFIYFMKSFSTYFILVVSFYFILFYFGRKINLENITLITILIVQGKRRVFLDWGGCTFDKGSFLGGNFFNGGSLQWRMTQSHHHRFLGLKREKREKS